MCACIACEDVSAEVEEEKADLGEEKFLEIKSQLDGVCDWFPKGFEKGGH